jgi:hypothetical protein
MSSIMGHLGSAVCCAVGLMALTFMAATLFRQGGYATAVAHTGPLDYQGYWVRGHTLVGHQVDQ